MKASMNNTINNFNINPTINYAITYLFLDW